MREEKRIDRILDKLKEHWKNCPDLRFGQLLINMGIMEDNNQFWHLEDDKWEKHLNEFSWSKK